MREYNKAEAKALVENIKAHQILFAITSEPDYEMDRTIVLEVRDVFIIIQGGHCSCYDFDEIEWGATEYTGKELSKVIEQWTYGEEADLRPLLEKYIGETLEG